jgi:aminobenzoyl-glutamate utilization protein B
VRRTLPPIALAAALCASGLFADVESIKTSVEADIEAHQVDLVSLADRIWEYAETALEETRSAAALADYAESQGFTVDRGVAEMPTAFVASYGSGRPIIGILGEYDALPGISQKAQSTQEALTPGAAGHGCGHNLFGAASLGAALAIKDQIAAGAISGTVRFYGTPAEESVGGKLYMLRAGLFDDVDAILAWHPSVETSADTASSQAMVDFAVEFEGKAAHAAYDPWNGRSAADAVEVFTFALNLMREHVLPSARMHYVVTDAGEVPNVVPSHARAWVWLRDSTHQRVDDMLERARAMVEGAALATGTTGRLIVQSGDWEMLPLLSGARILHDNLTRLGPLDFDAGENEFAREIQRATGVEPRGLMAEVKPLDLQPGEPEGGSTDVADVSWNAPTIHLSVTTAPIGAPWHAWPVVASGGMSIGHKGMIYAAKAMATTMVDLYLDPAKLAAVRAEFDERTAGVEYRAYIPEGPPPVPVD